MIPNEFYRCIDQKNIENCKKLDYIVKRYDHIDLE